MAAIEKTVAGKPSWVDAGAFGSALWKDERSFYRSRQYVPAWIENDEPTPQLDALIDALRRAEEHGLDAARYGLGDLERARGTERSPTFDSASVPELDARLTYAYLHYAADLLGWSANPKAIFSTWVVAPKKDDLPARLARAIASNSVNETLVELVPTHPQYAGLQTALAAERKSPTGHLDQIRMNLERWRWMPQDLGARYVLVNVPAYQMQVVEGETPALAMRVIVGDPKTPTPLFGDEMTHIVFSPVWNVPESIIRNEMAPRLVNDPGYLMRQEIEIVRGTGKQETIVDAEDVDWTDEQTVKALHFRQAPGPRNALGLVKFMFPNDFDVYLHDTPSESLFNRPHRALSHGCIRVENPVGFAHYLLQDQPEWTTDRIAAAMKGEQEKTATLKTKLPVHIGYWTAWANSDGSVTYTDDPYGLDQKQAAAGHFAKPAPEKPAPPPVKAP